MDAVCNVSIHKHTTESMNISKKHTIISGSFYKCMYDFYKFFSLNKNTYWYFYFKSYKFNLKCKRQNVCYIQNAKKKKNNNK